MPMTHKEILRSLVANPPDGELVGPHDYRVIDDVNDEPEAIARAAETVSATLVEMVQADIAAGHFVTRWLIEFSGPDMMKLVEGRVRVGCFAKAMRTLTPHTDSTHVLQPLGVKQ